MRLLTLTGVGGVGKTRVALAVAQRSEQDFADGARFVDLAPVSNASLVEAAILRSLTTGDADAYARLQPRLRSANTLLVLDNFEHVALAAPLLSDVLAECPSVRMIVTSRRPLRLRWEHEWPIAPLSDALAKEPQNDGLRKDLAIAQSRVGQHQDAYGTITPFLAKNQSDTDALMVALQAIYQVHAEGKSIDSADQDKAKAVEYARAYAAAKGPSQALVDKWLQFLGTTAK